MHKAGEVGSSITAENGKAYHLAVVLHERKAWFKAYAEGDAYDPKKLYFVKRIEQKYFDRERLAFDVFSQAGGHPGLVMPEAFIENQQRHYVVMPWMQELALDEHLKRNGSLSVQEVATVVREASDVLHFAARNGIINGDIKPANMLTGKPTRVIDWDVIYHGQPEGIDPDGSFIGTVPYCSREIVEGEMNGKRDESTMVYALAATTYFLLTESFPRITLKKLQGSTMYRAILKAMRDKEPVEKPSAFVDLPPGIDAVVLRSLSHDRAERHPNVVAFAQDLEQAIQGKPLRAPARPTIHISAAPPNV